MALRSPWADGLHGPRGPGDGRAVGLAAGRLFCHESYWLPVGNLLATLMGSRVSCVFAPHSCEVTLAKLIGKKNGPDMESPPKGT